MSFRDFGPATREARWGFRGLPDDDVLTFIAIGRKLFLLDGHQGSAELFEGSFAFAKLLDGVAAFIRNQDAADLKER